MPSIATGQLAASPPLPCPQTPGAKVHWYGKAGVTPGRKVGASAATDPAACPIRHAVRRCCQTKAAAAPGGILGGCAAAAPLRHPMVAAHHRQSDRVAIMFRKRSEVLPRAQVGHITVTAPTASEARRRLADIDPAAADALASSSSASADPPKVPPSTTLSFVRRIISCLCRTVSNCTRCSIQRRSTCIVSCHTGSSRDQFRFLTRICLSCQWIFASIW